MPGCHSLPCNSCSTQVDVSKAWNETWHVGKFVCAHLLLLLQTLTTIMVTQSNKSTSVLQASYHRIRSLVRKKKTTVLQSEPKLSVLGTAVYVNCILALTAEHPTYVSHYLKSRIKCSVPDRGRSDMTFFIDGVQVGTYSSEPDSSSPGYDYNVTVFAHERLSSGRHIIQIQSGHIEVVHL